MQPTVVGVYKVGVGRDDDTSDKVVLDEKEAVQEQTLLPEGKWSEHKVRRRRQWHLMLAMKNLNNLAETKCIRVVHKRRNSCRCVGNKDVDVIKVPWWINVMATLGGGATT